MTAHVGEAGSSNAVGASAAASDGVGETRREHDELSLVRGGPFYRILCRLGVIRGGQLDAVRQAVFVVALTWGPLVLLALVERFVRGTWAPLILDLSVQARLLVALPLLFLGDAALDVTTGHSVDRFLGGGFADDTAAAKRLVERARRRRDAVVPEAMMLVLAVGATEAMFWYGAPFTAWFPKFSGATERSAVDVWYAMIALPIVQFLFLRWLWRWAIWSRLLWKLSRLAGRLAPLHPDRRGGIAFMSDPVISFAGGVAAFSSVQAGAWISQVLHEGVPASHFYGPFWVLLVGAVLLTHAPSAVWIIRLWRLRHEGARKLGGFAVEYARSFDRKWLEGLPRDEDPLGSPDIQSLADLSHSFEVVDEIRVLPFGKRSPLVVAVAVVVPMIPLVLTQVPLLDLLRRLSGVALGRIAE